MQALTCVHRMQYNVGTMNDTTLQITIRGLDPATKKALTRKATNQGLSLNRYVLRALQQQAGIKASETRYQAMKQFLNTHHTRQADKQAFDTALAWADNTSIKKQRQEERDSSL